MLVLYQEMLTVYQNDPEQNCGQNAAILSTFDLLIASQKELLKYIKIAASFCYCWQLNEQPKPLNILTKAVQDCMKEERFWLVSRMAADTGCELSRILLACNRSIY